MKDSFWHGLGPRRVLVTLPLAVLFSAISCGSTQDDRPGAFAGNPGTGAAGGHGSHGGAGGAHGGAAGTSLGGSAGRGGTGGTLQDAGRDAPQVDAADATAGDAPAEVNGCVEYADRTSGDTLQTMPWDDDITYAAERCMKVHVGQTVRFVGDFGEHPLAPRGGDTPNPVAEETEFNEVGVFGYFCTIHPDMNGAIWVVAP